MSNMFSSMLRKIFAVGIVALSGQVLTFQESSACSVHDHNCQFHGVGRAVNPNVDPNSGTAAFIITESVDPSNNLDFDNNVLLQNGFGPYVVSATGFPTTPGQPYIDPGENERHVYPGQYQIDFNRNTAQARHSGDLNGLERVPGATGCQYSTAANCEEIKIIGNIPDTQGLGLIVRQKVHLYNAQNTPNPEIDTRSYAVATGRAYIRNFGHSANAEPALFEQNYNYDSLSGSRDSASALGGEHTYYIGYNDFDPHAVGASLWWNQQWQTAGNAYRVSGQHWYEDNIYKNVTTHKNKRFVSGMGEESTGDYGKNTRQVFVGTAPSQEYFNRIAEQNRLARIEANRVAKERNLAEAKSKDDYDRGCLNYDCKSVNKNTKIMIKTDPIYNINLTDQSQGWASNRPIYNENSLQSGDDYYFSDNLRIYTDDSGKSYVVAVNKNDINFKDKALLAMHNAGGAVEWAYANREQFQNINIKTEISGFGHYAGIDVGINTSGEGRFAYEYGGAIPGVVPVSLDVQPYFSTSLEESGTSVVLDKSVSLGNLSVGTYTDFQQGEVNNYGTSGKVPIGVPLPIGPYLGVEIGSDGVKTGPGFQFFGHQGKAGVRKNYKGAILH